MMLALKFLVSVLLFRCGLGFRIYDLGFKCAGDCLGELDEGC